MMNAIEARKIFDKVISETQDPDRIAKLELLREYFCNPAFKSELEKITFEMNYKEN